MNMNQFEVLAELAQDNSSWIDVAHYPATVVCRHMLRLADFAAEDPVRWEICRMFFEHPELSRRELGVIFSTGCATIQRKILPLPYFESDRRDLRHKYIFKQIAAGTEFDPDHLSLTYRRARRLCDFSSGQPVRWQAVRLAYSGLRMTQCEIADVCGVCVRTIRTYLAPINLTDPDDFKPAAKIRTKINPDCHERMEQIAG